MKLNKLTIFMIAVVAIGIFALPATLSVGVGQHKFRQIDSTSAGMATFCNRCHTGLGGTDSVQNEINASDKNLYFGAVPGTSTVHSSQSCGSCHALSAGYGAKTATGAQHAAVIPSCLKCHTAQGAGNSIKTTFGDVVLELGGALEAHKPFQDAAVASGQDDYACLGCHTEVAKGGSITYDYTLTPTKTVSGITIGTGTLH